ncbi:MULTISPECIES: FtsK/SpoIIIE domain-containing protein [unclassified Janthinobacterium]|uniref:FtsK/SpoIIIE domain-containing protein n=1 Tax=unclassified Janthinobacterium TaxID=2610881 RepID=UPI001E4AC377|nr:MULTISPECIES: FtsK/SpoIIIE domain-containing protein [unclassified Janthinobacterium]MCC7643313.1 DNA translocase FtsK [Janthinobacterium sp. EB271-G4-3-1]MCC7693802.1 DNA translocase FtsK [Janthinobacterium sp. EB271-G4-3-2]
MNEHQISDSDALVGSIALEYVLHKLQDQLADTSFRGAFHVLAGFSVAQLVGFVQARDAHGGWATRLALQFPAGVLAGFDIDQKHLTEESSVGVRNRPRTAGTVVIAAELENDAGASLADSDRTDASDLKDKAIAGIWVKFVADSLGMTLYPQDARHVEALLKGLFDTGSCPTVKVGAYLRAVLQFYKDEPLVRAAGKALPVIGLPLSEDAFASLNEAKMKLPSQWAERFRTHYGLECYLEKRGKKFDLLDQETMRDDLRRLRDGKSMPPVPEEVLGAFEAYIEAAPRSEAVQAFLYEHDWQHAQRCFDKDRKISRADFATLTRKALVDENVSVSMDDDLLMTTLEKMPRKSAAAPEEYRDFFERHTDAIEKDRKLYMDWADFVHGKRVECTDLLRGIFECLQRFVGRLDANESFYIVLEGKSQEKNNSYIDRNRRACEYFERNYRSLQVKSGNKIRFSKTQIFSYTDTVWPSLKDRPKYNGAKKSNSATTLEFVAAGYVERSGLPDVQVCSFKLFWKFPTESILSQEAADFDGLRRYAEKKKTCLVHCQSEYEGVGRKGVPLSLSLNDTQGFAEVARQGGRGAFVPAQTKIRAIPVEWDERMDHIRGAQSIGSETIATLQAQFEHFEALYSLGVCALAHDAMDHQHTEQIAASYRSLLLAIASLTHEESRRRLLKIVLSVGQAQVARSGRRPSVAVVCPWHPLRMEATKARQQQAIAHIARLAEQGRAPFSDGSHGALFFREVEQLLTHPLYPEMAIAWDENEPSQRIGMQALGSYSLHHVAERSSMANLAPGEDDFVSAANTIEHEVTEYLRLQPHERDNLSILLYDCESAALPAAVVNKINRINEARDGDKITCQILLTHRSANRLREIYRELVSRGVETVDDPTEGTGDFLARVRVNITAANRLRNRGRTQPVDIAYCRDLISREAKTEPKWVERFTRDPIELQPHQWNRRLPLAPGDRKVLLQLVCPVQTVTGWTYLYAIAQLCGVGAAEAWANDKCSVLMRTLDFDDSNVDRIFNETHDLAAWVVNEDELLDRKLLEQCKVKVIRYVQRVTHGRNLIISSKARDTLLVNTLREKLRGLVASDTSPAWIANLGARAIEDANRISGGLVLKAARRANNTNELLGMVLSRYLVQAELGKDRAIAWCFLDDYSQWLGKKDGASMADLLVLAPIVNPDGSLHLDIVVTEAKFVKFDGLNQAATVSAKQLMDTLGQINDALDETFPTIDQATWLARISDLLILQTVTMPGKAQLDASAWKRAVRDRLCTFRVWGYSHVFVYEPQGYTTQVSRVVGLVPPKPRSKFSALQEVFGPGDVRALLSHFQAQDHQATLDLRHSNGHLSFGKSNIRHLMHAVQDVNVGRAVEPSSDARPAPVVDALHDAEIGTRKAVDDHGVRGNPGSVLPLAQRAGGGKENGKNELIEFLEERASRFSSSEEEGQAWLSEMSAKLRHALISRGLTAKLASDGNLVLTPNAGIIKLQGTTSLTVQAVEAKASEIFTSDGIQIISVTPESGRISIAVKRPVREVLHTEAVLLAYLKTYNAEENGEQILIGIAEEDGRPVLLNPSVQPHTLVAGMTGSGKSILIQNIMLTIAATRSPAEALIYLIDPKFGLDYRPLESLPHIQAGSAGIIDEPLAAIETLKKLVDVMDDRYRTFKEAGVPNIGAYRRATGNEMPTLWIIHDEFTDWMMIEEYRKVVPDVVNRLSVKARAAGIFLIFAAQRPDKDAMPMQLRSQLGNRLTLKVDNDATSEIAMGIKNGGAARLLGQGHMLVRIGQPESLYVQVPFIDVETTVPLIVKIIVDQYKTRTASA